MARSSALTVFLVSAALVGAALFLRLPQHPSSLPEEDSFSVSSLRESGLSFSKPTALELHTHAHGITIATQLRHSSLRGTMDNGKPMTYYELTQPIVAHFDSPDLDLVYQKQLRFPFSSIRRRSVFADAAMAARPSNVKSREPPGFERHITRLNTGFHVQQPRFQFYAFDRLMQVDLQRHDGLFAADFTHNIVHADRAAEVFPAPENCYYQGELAGHKGSMVVLRTCDNVLHGYIKTGTPIVDSSPSDDATSSIPSAHTFAPKFHSYSSASAKDKWHSIDPSAFDFYISPAEHAKHIQGAAAVHSVHHTGSLPATRSRVMGDHVIVKLSDNHEEESPGGCAAGSHGLSDGAYASPSQFAVQSDRVAEPHSVEFSSSGSLATDIHRFLKSPQAPKVDMDQHSGHSHTHGHSHNMFASDTASKPQLMNLPFPRNLTTTQLLEVTFVGDAAVYFRWEANGGISRPYPVDYVTHAAMLLTIVDRLYQQIGWRIRWRASVLNSADPYPQSVSGSGTSVLNAFTNYSKVVLDTNPATQADAYGLLTGMSFGSPVGVAWNPLGSLRCNTGAMMFSCIDWNSATGSLVSQNWAFASVCFAHEIGHNLGAIHDEDAGCSATTGCCGNIMNTAINRQNVFFSPCALGNFGNDLANSACLSNSNQRSSLVVDCLSGQYYSGPEPIGQRVYSKCLPCSAPCYECESATNCTRCYDTHTLEFGVCIGVNSCTSGSFRDFYESFNGLGTSLVGYACTDCLNKQAGLGTICASSPNTYLTCNRTTGLGPRSCLANPRPFPDSYYSYYNVSRNASATPTPSASATASATGTASSTASSTATASPSSTATASPSSTATQSATATATATTTATGTATGTGTGTGGGTPPGPNDPSESGGGAGAAAAGAGAAVGGVALIALLFVVWWMRKNGRGPWRKGVASSSSTSELDSKKPTSSGPQWHRDSKAVDMGEVEGHTTTVAPVQAPVAPGPKPGQADLLANPVYGYNDDTLMDDQLSPRAAATRKALSNRIAAEKQLSSSGVAAGAATAVATADGKPPLPPGWQELMDSTTNTPYYYNEATQSTQWERPAAPIVTPAPAPQPIVQPVISVSVPQTSAQPAPITPSRPARPVPAIPSAAPALSPRPALPAKTPALSPRPVPSTPSVAPALSPRPAAIPSAAPALSPRPAAIPSAAPAISPRPAAVPAAVTPAAAATATPAVSSVSARIAALAASNTAYGAGRSSGNLPGAIQSSNSLAQMSSPAPAATTPEPAPVAASSNAAVPLVARAASLELHLPAGWEEFLDDSTGYPYYYNSSTGETSWSRPV